jgi:hypothetical protein
MWLTGGKLLCWGREVKQKIDRIRGVFHWEVRVSNREGDVGIPHDFREVSNMVSNDTLTLVSNIFFPEAKIIRKSRQIR